MSKNIVIKCASSDENYNADFDYALVRVTRELLDTIAARRKLFIAAHEQDCDLDRMIFLDRGPEYLAECDLELWAEKQEGPVVHEVELLTAYETDWIEVPDSLDPAKMHGTAATSPPTPNNPKLLNEEPDRERDFYTECDRMHVCETCMWWCCSPKYVNINISTEAVEYADLEELLAEAPAEAQATP